MMYPMTLASCNVSFMLAFSEEGTSNDSGVIENVDVQCLKTLHLRNLRK